MSDKQKRHSLPILPRPENVTVSYASLENQIYSELNNGQIIMQKKSNFMGPAGVPEALLQIRRASVASTTRDSNQDKMKGGFDYKGSGSEFSDGRERKDSKEKEVSNKVEKLVEKKIEEEFARKDSVLRNANVNSDKIEREVSKSKDSLRILEARTISPPIDRSVRSSSSTPVISPIKANRDISNQSLESSEKSESNSIFNSVYSPPSSPLSSLKAPDASIPVAKILLLGDSGVGKSAIMGRFTDNRFDEGLLSTAGVDFKSKLHTIDNQQLRLTIWDTAGQERFKTITKAYYRGATAIILVYDVTDADSYKSIAYWMQNIKLHASENVEKILVGNKIDKQDQIISTERGFNLATDYEVPFLETSAKENINIEEIFVTIGRNILKNRNNLQEKNGFRIEKKAKKSKCCK